jgi:DME family drug/metabolite transporter
MLLHLGVLTVGLAYYLYGAGLRWLPTSTAVTLTLAEPLTAALVAVVVLDERLEPLGWLGAALVLVGLALVGLVAGPRRAGSTDQVLDHHAV